MKKNTLKPISQSVEILSMRCAGDNDPITQAELTQVKDACKKLSTTLGGMVDDLQGELKNQFVSVKNQINTMLAALPETDKVPAAMESNWILRQLLCTLTSAQQLIANVTEYAKTASAKHSSMIASMPADIDTAVTGRIAKGELFTKADHEAALIEATKKGRTEAESASRKISERRTALASATLPLPKETLLNADDAAFTAAETEAKRRHTLLSPYKEVIKEDRMTILCWDVDTTSFEAVLDAHKAIKPEVKSRINPIAGATTPGTVGRIDRAKIGLI